jgi:hypothetical protein
MTAEFETALYQHPLRGKPVCQNRHEGVTVWEIIQDAGIEKRFLLSVEVTISSGTKSTVVPMHMWDRVRPRAGSHVLIGPKVHGPVAGLLLSAVIPQAASYVAGTLFALEAGSMAYALTYAAVTIVGALAVNALIPPPVAPGQILQDDPNYSITGTGNAENRYGVYPTVLGRHQIYPPKTARGFTEGEGDEIYYRGRYTFGYGPVALEALRIGTTPITEFEGVELEFLNVDQTETLARMPELAGLVKAWRSGTEALSLYPDDIAEDAYSVRLEKDVQVTRTTRERAVSATADVTCQGLVKFGSNNSKQTHSLDVKFEFQKVGDTGWTDAGTETYSGASTANLRFSKLIEFPEAGEYDVRVTRLTEDSDDTTIRDDAFLTAIRSVQAGELPSHADIAEVAVKIRASDQLNGQLDDLNGIALQMAPVWNGSAWSALQPVRHPAWIYARALMGPMIAKPLADARLQLQDLLDWATEEPHWTCDAVIDQSTRVADVLDMICGAGRARRFLRDLKYSIIRDGGAGPIVQQFSPRNSYGFKGRRIFPKEIHGFRVRCISERLEWQQDEILVHADGFHAGNATEFETLELRGVVLSKDDATGGNAWRLGRYHLAQIVLRPEEFSWQSDLEHLRVNMGDKVRLVHDVPLIGVGSGRITSLEASGGDLTALSLDEEFALEGAAYRLIVRQATGEEVIFQAGPPQIEGGPWTPAAGTPSAGIAAGDLVLVEETTQESMAVLVKSIHHSSGQQATLTGVPAAPEVLQADQGTIPDYVPNITTVQPRATLRPAAPDIQSVVPTVLYGPARVVARVQVSAFDRYDTARYHVTLIDPFGVSSSVGPFLEGDFDVPLEKYGLHKLQIARENRAGLISPVTEVEAEWSIGLTTPEDVTKFRADLVNSHVTLTWNADDPAAKHYELRFLASGNNGGWSQALQVASEVQGGAATVPALAGSYLIRAVGHWGRVSEAVTQVSVSDIAVFGLNVVETLTEEPAFTGQKTGLAVEGLRLVLSAGNTSAQYELSEVVDLGAIYPSRLSGDINATGYLASFTMAAWPNLSAMESLSGTAAGDTWLARLMMQTTDDNPASGSAVWRDWEEFRAGDHLARGYRFRLDVESFDAAVLVDISRLEVTVDMPDRVDGGDDVNCPVGGIYVPFVPPFKKRPAITITGQDLPSGAVVRRSNVTNAGFNIRFETSSGADLACTFDWVAKGYGRES